VSQLKTLLEEVFGPDGWLVCRGGHHLPEQLEYACAIADWLQGDPSKPVALFEGETGTGKTLGYLFPLILNWVLTGDRFVVATHTVALQKQLLDGDLSVVEEYLVEHRYPLPRIQQRLGMRHFVDPSRVHDVVSEMPKAKDLKLFGEWAEHTARHGSGLIEEWIELYGPLPEGVQVDSICLTSLSEPGSNRAYEDTKYFTPEADGILTSHMMVLLEAHSGFPILDLSEDTFKHILFDEADQVPMGAEPLSNRRIQIREIIREVRAIVGRGSSALDKELLGGQRELSRIEDSLKAVATLRPTNEFILSSEASIPSELAEPLGQLQAVGAHLKSKIERSSLVRIQKDHRAQEALKTLRWVGDFDPNSPASGSSVQALAWSPKLKIPSLMHQQDFPAAFVSRLWRNKGLRVGLTSATLGASQNAEDRASFVPLKSQLGIATENVVVEVQLSPARFGSMEIILADDSVPGPIAHFDDEEGAKLNHKWVAYVASMVAEASASGPTLVLTASYIESARLGRELSQLSPIVHRYAHSLKDAVDAFRAGSHPIMITPAAWQGVSIRDMEGNQLVQNLVITRIPFTPPNETAERLAKHLALEHGRISAQQAVNYERLKHRERVLIKMRQGIGRLLRKESDSGCLWICDPRFPAHGVTSQNRYFVGAIPKRFHDAYRDAQVFQADGQYGRAHKEIPTVVTEMLNL
jgi:ATP-dependent DNA helicase DinG